MRDNTSAAAPQKAIRRVQGRVQGQAAIGRVQGKAAIHRVQGVTQQGLQTALTIKQSYKAHDPICVPGEDTRILSPEHLLNENLDLMGLDDPLPLALVASCDPESPMAIAAVTRLGPQAARSPFAAGVLEVAADVSRHPLVKECVSLIKQEAFSPDAVANVRRHAQAFVLRSREQYAEALRGNLRLLLDGAIAPRQFVREFFDLTEAGNLRTEIRKKLILSLLLSDSVRPSVKFLFLENFERLPRAVRIEIVGAVLRADDSRHTDIIKEELRWMVTRQSCEAVAGQA